MMTKENCESHNTEAASIPIVPLPIALYSSNGLLFELYDGGQPRRSFAIRWETIKPIRISKKHENDRQQSSHTFEPA